MLQDARTEPELPREVQHSAKKSLKGSQLYHLDPFLDSYGIQHVGGRLRRAEMEYGEKHPIVLPKNHHVSQHTTTTEGDKLLEEPFNKQDSGLLEVTTL